MPKPGLYPTVIPRRTESHAERAVYEALSKQLPKGWYAWHSVRVRTTAHGDAEADFIVADPKRGALILEIKGGKIERRDGHWYSNSQPLKCAPREQALRFQRALKDLLHSKSVSPPALGIVTVFPDSPFSDPPSGGDLEECVLGPRELKWLDSALPEVMTRCLSPRSKPQGQWLQAIHDLWGERWVPRLNLGDFTEVRLDELLKLDAEQLEVLRARRERFSARDRWSRHRQDGSGVFHGAAARRTRPESPVPLLHPGAGALACGANLKPKPDGVGNQELRRRPFRTCRQTGSGSRNAGVLG